MTDARFVDFLASSPYFQGVAPEDLAVLARLFEIEDFAAGETIFEEGDEGNSWYLVLEGEVQISKRGNERPDHTLATLERGEGFGEMALLDGAPRMAAAEAADDARVARLPRESFLRMVAHSHPAAVHLLQSMAGVLCQRLREMTWILQDMVEDPGPSSRRADEVPAGLDGLLRSVMLQH